MVLRRVAADSPSMRRNRPHRRQKFGGRFTGGTAPRRVAGHGRTTRVVDKRKVRRDRADHFSSLAEGVRKTRCRMATDRCDVQTLEI